LQDKEKTQNILEFTYNEQYKYAKIYERIVEYLENGRGYLNSDFKIGKISNDLNINPLYISRAISLQRDMNFVHFINFYRIAHAKNMILNNSQYTLEYIYLSSGFKNQSSFIRAFKQQEGKTPSEWREENREE
jgi:AraC-like DNA-binding protein